MAVAISFIVWLDVAALFSPARNQSVILFIDHRFSSGILSQASQLMSRPGKATFLNGQSLASQSRIAESNRDSSPL